MFSQTAEYALRAVACLARRHGVAMTTRQVADAVRVPPGYLAKVLQALVRAGIVTSQRGPNGGFLLARPPADLTLLDVVRVADGSRRIASCPLGLLEHGANLCPLHQRLDDAAALAERMLGRVTVADVLVAPMCAPTAQNSAARAGHGVGKNGAARAGDGTGQNRAARAAEGAGPSRPDRGGTPRLPPLCNHARCSPGAAEAAPRCA